MAVYVYLRVSTSEQDIDAQMVSVKKKLQELQIPEQEVIIFKDEGTSGLTKAINRKQFSVLYNKLKKGDILIVSELSRIGRSLSDVIMILDSLINEKNVRVISVKEGLDSQGDKLYFKIFSTIISLFADLEREFIRMRTIEGLQKARKKGKRLGRPRKLNYKLVLTLRKEGKSVKEIAELTGYNKNSIYTILKRYGSLEKTSIFDNSRKQRSD